MNLISCDECGVVLDRDKLSFAHDLYTDYGEIDKNKASWSCEYYKYVAMVHCPVCGEEILEK